MTKLQRQIAADPNCGDEPPSVSTRFVSETARLEPATLEFRSVTTVPCGERADAVLFSLFGVPAGATKLPRNVEIISFDDSEGVFNYYEADGTNITFFGNSKDLLKGSPDGQVRRCAGCHVGGGLVMKEIESPWLHWEEDSDDVKETDALAVNHAALLGDEDGADEMEDTVKNGNSDWNSRKITYLTTKEPRSIQDLLKPLFCTVELNIQPGTVEPRPQPGSDNGDVFDSLPAESLLDLRFDRDGIGINPADYDAALQASGQQIRDAQGKQVGNHIDTFLEYAFVHRSSIDQDYVDKLAENRIVDDDFITDVLMVDFTRHVFSSDRCALLAFAPEVTGEVTPAKIRDGFIARLKAAAPAAGTPEATLLANLTNPNDRAAHTVKLDAFMAACENLDSPTLVKNALAITSLNRNKARGEGRKIIEFAETLPFDNLNTHPEARLHPTTCELVNHFVAPSIGP